MFQVRAEVGTDQVPVLYILDKIGDDGKGGGTTVQRVRQFLNKYAGSPKIKVMISSSGGDAWAGTAIYDQLMRFPGEVHTYGSGIVASAASTIFMAGSIRELSGNCQFMIHEAWAQASGRASDFRTAGSSLDQLNRLTAEIYANRSGQPIHIIKQWMSEEKWLTPQDAKQFGFASMVSADVIALASVDLSRFKNVPQSVLRYQEALAPLMKAQQKMNQQAAARQLEQDVQAVLDDLDAEQNLNKPQTSQPATPKCLADVTRLANASKPLSAVRILQAGMMNPRKPASGVNAPKSMADLVRFK